MKRNSFFIQIFALAALVAIYAGTASAEYRLLRVSRGNNVGMGFMCDWCCPWITADWTGNTIQFPKGSGNLILNDAWTVGMMTARDINNDGAPEDTLVMGSGGRDNMPFWCSIYAEATLSQLVAGGEDMESAASARGGRYLDRVWSSTDAAEVAEWPVEGRWPISSSGEPIIHGAETIFEHTGDVFNSWGGPACGFYMGWACYFLDFGESNNMVYTHIQIHNVTHFMKWNATYKDKCAAVPDGWKWWGMILFNNWRQMGFGKSSNLGWAYHPAKEINVLWSSRTPRISNWTPQDPPLLGMKVLAYPRLREQTTGLIQIHTVAGTEFGFSAENNLLAMGLAHPKVYRAVVNKLGMYTGQTNPFTGKAMIDGYPGILHPDDARYNQWLWGGSSNWNHYTFWGELHDVAPKDTFSIDFVIMFSPTGVTPIVHPNYDIANIDDPGMQTAFAPQAHYAAVAQTTYNGGYLTPETPVAPLQTIIPGDRQVTITWSDINLQTPDKYYYFLRDNNLDPDHLYREYDFEGYRLYRSFVGPNDSHSEMIYNCSLSDGNVAFFFVDKYDNDQPYYRMRDGMKVWYALVPYDRNYDNVTGAMFSLPAPTSGKVWNRAGEAGLYNVIPRSDASNFKMASLGAVSFVPIAGAPTPGATATLTGDGTGKLTEAPKILAPAIKEVAFIPVNNERLTSDKTVTLLCTDATAYDRGCTAARMAGEREIKLVDGSSMSSGMYLDGGGDDAPKHTFNGPTDANGANYAVDVTFTGISMANAPQSPLYYYLDAGGYAGASIDLHTSRWCGEDSRPGTAPSNIAFTKSGQFTVTWKNAGGGNLTVDVVDQVRGGALPHVDFVDEVGWGFQPLEDFGGSSLTEGGNLGNYIDEAFAQKLPKAERQYKMKETLAANRTAEFGFWIDGLCFVVSKDGGLTMPTDGTVWTVIVTFGSWNGDKTVFTQYPDLPQVGDKWTVEIKASSMKAEDADLSKVRVVPNPYIASSYLDLSSSQRRIEFVNLPDRCTIRIYTLGGNLVNVLNHIGANRTGWGNYTDWDRLSAGVPKEYTGYDNHSGTEPWNLRNRFGQTIASGLYFFHVTDSRGKNYTGKFYVID